MEQLPPTVRQKVHDLFVELIQVGMPVDMFDTPLEIRLGLASAVGALGMKLREELRNNTYPSLMQYLVEATDEELLAFQQIKVTGAVKEEGGLKGFEIDLSRLGGD